MSNKEVIRSGPDGRIVLMDSISSISREDEGSIVISSSHGGVAAGEVAGRVRLGVVFFNDAGVGKNKAGIRALKMLEEKGVAAGTVSHMSARIGESIDSWENGIISHLNENAEFKGFKVGEPVRDAVMRFVGE